MKEKIEILKNYFEDKLLQDNVIGDHVTDFDRLVITGCDIRAAYVASQVYHFCFNKTGVYPKIDIYGYFGSYSDALNPKIGMSRQSDSQMQKNTLLRLGVRPSDIDLVCDLGCFEENTDEYSRRLSKQGCRKHRILFCVGSFLQLADYVLFVRKFSRMNIALHYSKASTTEINRYNGLSFCNEFLYNCEMARFFEQFVNMPVYGKYSDIMLKMPKEICDIGKTLMHKYKATLREESWIKFFQWIKVWYILKKEKCTIGDNREEMIDLWQRELLLCFKLSVKSQNDPVDDNVKDYLYV